MATTHSLVADTRMEDLPGLASGDTIALGGHGLTCESNLSAITGLYATGTGTIRLLDGGNCDFSGSSPLPETVTIEGGTEDNPLPAHGDYGYVGRASARIAIKGRTVFYGKIVSHCLGNSSRVQMAVCTSATSSTITLDRTVDWEPGDVIAWQTNSPSNTIPFPRVTAIDGFTISHDGNTMAPAGAMVLLMTAGFVVHADNRGFPLIAGSVLGDELGLSNTDWGTASLQGEVKIERIAAIGPNSSGASHTVLGSGAHGSVGCLVTVARGVGISSTKWSESSCGPLDIRHEYALGNGGADINSFGFRGKLRVKGGCILKPSVGVIGCAEYADCNLPSTLYSQFYKESELVIRATEPRLCTVHRAAGIVTLVDRTDIEVPTSLPDAWRLDPIEDGTAWHDVPMTVLPGKTLSCIWYWMLGEEGATAGCQILDGEGPGWGSIAMNPGMAEVLAETTAPADASPLRPFVTTPIAWRNTSREIRKVVLRGWARGGTAYSRIGPAAGGIA